MIRENINSCDVIMSDVIAGTYLHICSVVEDCFPRTVAEDVEHEVRESLRLDRAVQVDVSEDVDVRRSRSDVSFDRKSSAFSSNQRKPQALRMKQKF